jgi:uncharacterized protein YyaL (SSP411 family)/aryl-alcohol dehydrogenase-like predicted oxidoreductase
MSSSATDRPTNRLAGQTSPYLLQHAHNPVDWYPWGEEALRKARTENKPILLSIGYSACHWCHVMERECFEDADIAKLMNELYVCIKVDREERPDLDDIYMAATVSLTGQGGWPMNVLLTPDQRPFFAGTYFPPRNDENRPGFPTILEHFASVWRERPEELNAAAEEITQRLRRQFKGLGKVLSLEPEILDMAMQELATRFDQENGGFSPAPKFPPAVTLQLLLRYFARSQDPRCLGMAQKTLDAMAMGGIYDQLGGGFARYSTDDRWLVPHFEKMLYDNAQLARVYLEAFQLTRDGTYQRVAVETMDYVLREMTHPEGGFYSATDADSEGEEGKFFVWTPAEIKAALGEEKGARFCTFFDVTEEGNWEGKSVLNVPRPLEEVAGELSIEPPELLAEILASRHILLKVRSQRVAPGLDDKILTSWNGLMLSTLCEGFRTVGDHRYLEAARKCADFLEDKLRDQSGALLRTFRDGQAHLKGYLEDYAFLAEGLIDLYEGCGDERYLRRAVKLAEQMMERFAHAEGGFYDTASDAEELIVRHRSGTDAAVPSANAVAASVLIRLSHLLGRPEWRDRALECLTAFGRELRQMPSAFCRSLGVVDYALSGPLEITWTTPHAEIQVDELTEMVGQLYLPNRSVAWKTPVSAMALPALDGKELTTSTTVYFCHAESCAAPVTDAEQVIPALQTLQGKNRLEIHPRITGRATPTATARLAAENPRRFAELGTTGLQVSRLGFGTYRIDDETQEHFQALEQAIEDGLNLIDTSTNYTDGSSERLIGTVLRKLQDRREQIVVVSKVGYIQGQNLQVAQAKQQMGQPYEDVVEYEPDCWHCIHPQFIAEQLERSLSRLNLETLDVLLLHNPEYFLMQAAETGAADKAALDEQFYARITQAFQGLEAMVEAGKIGAYGVSSNTLPDDPGNLDATSLARFVACAEAAGGAKNHFKVVEFPFNLLESQATEGLLELAQKHRLGVLTNRSVNGFVGQTLVRLADFETDEDEVVEFPENLRKLAALETEYRNTFGQMVQGPGADQLFRFSEHLGDLPAHLENLEHWTQIETTRIRPSLQEQVGALNQAMVGPVAGEWVSWRDRYSAQFRNIINDLEELATRKSQQLSDSVREKIEPHMPGERHGQPLSRLALWTLISTPGVTSALVGMRRPDYVEDAMEVLDWPRLADVGNLYRDLHAWQPNLPVMA